MASEPEKVPPAEETVVGEEAVTQVDDDGWPVADLYVVDPDDTADAVEPSDTSETVVLAQSEPAATAPRGWIPPNAGGLMLAIAGTVGLFILVAVLLGLRDDEPGATNSASTPARSSSGTNGTSGSSTTPAPADGEVTLRDLGGMPLAKARAALEQDGLRVVVRRLDADRPRGEVLTQDPAAGTVVASGDRIVLVVSRGADAGAATPTPAAPPSSQVPDVVGLAASDAVAAIRDAGFEARVRAATSSRPAGTVLRQSPAAESEASEGSTVVLDVAKKPPVVQRVAVPDVVGTTASAARRALRSAGLTVAIVTVESRETEGTVVAQSPRAGADVREGAAVTLNVSSGVTQVTVPDVTGVDVESARLGLVNAGFEVGVTERPTTDPAQDGLVVDQTPAAGTKASEGDVVTLTVARFG